MREIESNGHTKCKRMRDREGLRERQGDRQRGRELEDKRLRMIEREIVRESDRDK